MAKTTSTPAPLPQIKALPMRTWHDRLLAWYRTHGRHELPWRQTDDPYKIWLSEVMLQQTQVATVLARFYHPFLQMFPTVQSLAEAPREKVMKAWEGLGYYRRAGFLHEAAKMIVEGDLVPYASLTPAASGSRSYGATQDILNRWHTLPGIGKNTAHAIAAFAYRQPVAILEANVKRIVARVFAWEMPKEEQLWAGAEMLLNAREPFDHNQAMMDLGSLICTPRNPHCTVCPANRICAGKHAPELYPARKAKKATPVREVVIAVQRDAAGRFYLEQRSEALLGGLYGFPQHPVSSFPRRRESRGAAQAILQDSRLRGNDGIGEVTHTYSHFKLIGQVQLIQTHSNGGPGWFTREEIRDLALSGVDYKVLALVDARHSPQKKAGKSPRKRTAR